MDWWALGIILYEFLIGIVPFVAQTPDALFANIINEEVEYPEGEEALDSDAECLIRMLLEKNPVDRLGTIGGAPAVMGHPFFGPLDFDSLLRQKAEFIPHLENDEDTSYFDSRSDRYNHDAESADDELAPMFWSFSTASPRHSIVGGLDLPVQQMAALQAAHAAAVASGGTTEDDKAPEFAQPTSLNRRVSTMTNETDEGVHSITSGASTRSAFSLVHQQKDSLPTPGGGLPSRGTSIGSKADIVEGGIMPSVIVNLDNFIR